MERLHSVSFPTLALDHPHVFTTIAYFIVFEILKTMLNFTIKQIKCESYLWRPQSLKIKSNSNKSERKIQI